MKYSLFAAFALLWCGVASAQTSDCGTLQPLTPKSDRGTVIGMSLLLHELATGDHELVQYSAAQLQQMGSISLKDEDYGTGVSIEKVFFDVMYPDFYVKRPVHSRAWVEQVDGLIWDTSQMTSTQIAMLGNNSDWTQNDAMIVVGSEGDIDWSSCRRPGHSGDDQGGGHTW